MRQKVKVSYPPRTGRMEKVTGRGERVPGRRGACRWSVVQLHHDEELEPMHGYYGAIAMGIEVQKTIKRASVTSLWVTVRVFVHSERTTPWRVGPETCDSQCVDK